MSGDERAAEAPAVEGVHFRQGDGGWYLVCAGREQGPFLYRPTMEGAWERRRAADDGSGATVLERFTRFDAAGEQVTVVARYLVRAGGRPEHLGTHIAEEPPSPERYGGVRLAPPAGDDVPS